jgi:CheY-like chemotaxis protein
MMGAEFLARSKELAPHAVRMMLTGYSDVETATQAINDGQITRFITKPWDDNDLTLTLRDAIKRFSLEEDNRQLAVQLKQTNEQLEEMVLERTRELRTALEKNTVLTAQLEFRVRELEGQDRISRYLLELRPLEEAMQMIVETVAEVLELESVAIYLGTTTPPWRRVATSSDSAAAALSAASIRHLSSAPEAMAVEGGQQGAERVMLFPILRGQDVLGAIEFGWSLGPQGEEEIIEAVSSFSLQAAMAISDSEAHQSIDEWDEDLGEIDNLIDNLIDKVAGD